MVPDSDHLVQAEPAEVHFAGEAQHVVGHTGHFLEADNNLAGIF